MMTEQRCDDRVGVVTEQRCDDRVGDGDRAEM